MPTAASAWLAIVRRVAPVSVTGHVTSWVVSGAKPLKPTVE